MNLHKKMEVFADRNLLSVDFIKWQNEVVDRISKKQQLPFASYRKKQMEDKRANVQKYAQ